MTADELVNLIVHSRSLSDGTKRNYLKDLERYLRFAGRRPEQWTREATQRFYDGLIDGGMKVQSANRILASLAYAAKWYSTRAGNANLDFTRIQQARVRSKEPAARLTEGQARQILDTCLSGSVRDRRDLAMFVVMLETGMRRMSIAGMCWDQLPTEPYPAALVPVKRKDRLESVPLSDTAILALTPWRAWCAKNGVRKGPVFRALSTKNALSDNALSRVSIYHIVSEHADDAKLEGIHPHIFRHTFTSWRTEAGIEPHVIAAATGHAFNLGALGNYIDRIRLGEQIRGTTPAWLAEYVQKATR